MAVCLPGVGPAWAESPELTYPGHVNQLLGAFPAETGAPHPTVEQFIPDLRIARDVRGDTCVVRVPAELIFGRTHVDQRVDRVCWVLSDQPTDQWRESLRKAKSVYVQFWCVPLAGYDKVGPAIVDSLRPHQPDKFARAEMVHLGNGQNYAVFACLPRMEWPILQQRLSLAGGDNPIDKAMDALDTTGANTDLATRCYRAMADCNDEAIDAIDYLIAIGSPHRRGAVEAMSRSDSTAVGEWLVDLAGSEDLLVAAAAKESLLQAPRLEAKDLYVRWLAEDTDKGSVARHLDACAAVEAQGATAHLPAVLAGPYRLREFFKAMDLYRDLSGRPIPADLREAAEQIVTLADQPLETDDQKQQAVDAVDALVTADDTEAVAAIGVQMALHKPRRSRGTLVNRAGVYVLHSLVDDIGLKFVKQLADASTDPGEVRQLRTLVNRLENLKPAKQATSGKPAQVANPSAAAGLSGPASPDAQIRPTTPSQGTLPWNPLE